MLPPPLFMRSACAACAVRARSSARRRFSSSPSSFSPSFFSMRLRVMRRRAKRLSSAQYHMLKRFLPRLPQQSAASPAFVVLL